MRLKSSLPSFLKTFHLPQLETSSRLSYLQFALVGAYICGILFSARLWFGLGRSFPRTPLVSEMPDFLSLAEYVLSLLLLAVLAYSFFSGRPTRYLVSVTILTLLLVVLDLTRLQPWVYQYFLTLTVLAFLKSATTDANQTSVANSILFANQLIVAFLYFWSGIQKLNWSFGNEVLPGLLEWAGIPVPASYLPYMSRMALAFAGGEALIGLALIARRTRRIAVVLAVALHLAVLGLLVIARNNSMVWPWNVAMIIIVVLLFWKFNGPLAEKLVWRPQGSNFTKHLPKAVIVICGLAPALSFVGWWDLNLSGALYSGNAPVPVIHISERIGERLSVTARSQVFKTAQGESMLPVYEWSMAELNVPPYPEMRAFRQVGRPVCAYAENPLEVELIVRERPLLIDGSYTVTRLNCQHLSARLLSRGSEIKVKSF